MSAYNEELLHPCAPEKVQRIAEDRLVGHWEEGGGAFAGEGREVEVVGVYQEYSLESGLKDGVWLVISGAFLRTFLTTHPRKEYTSLE